MYYFVKSYEKNKIITPEYGARIICLVPDDSCLIYIPGLDHDNLPDDVKIVSQSLNILLISGEKFPPAITLSVRKFENIKNTIFTQNTFEDVFSELLYKYLNNSSLYIFAEATNSSEGDTEDYLLEIDPNSFSWIINYDIENDAVLYIAWDGYLEYAPSSRFKVDKEELKKKFVKIS